MACAGAAALAVASVGAAVAGVVLLSFFLKEVGPVISHELCEACAVLLEILRRVVVGGVRDCPK